MHGKFDDETPGESFEKFLISFCHIILRPKYDIYSGGRSINQSINVEFVGRHYTTRPGAPAESVKSAYLFLFTLADLSMFCLTFLLAKNVIWRTILNSVFCTDVIVTLRCSC